MSAVCTHYAKLQKMDVDLYIRRSLIHVVSKFLDVVFKDST